MTNKNKYVLKISLLLLLIVAIHPSEVYGGVINMDINGSSVDTLEIIILLTVMSLLPSILIMMTSFTRIIIVLSFLKNALGLQQTPPNQVMVGIALLLTLFIMSPVIDEINVDAYQPYKNEEITQQEFFTKASEPIKVFMLKQTGNSELKMFMDMSRDEKLKSTKNLQELPLTIIIPSFVTSELKRAFIIGFLLFIPFLIIDMIVSSILMSMGMIMLPPVMISLPFKLLLFVLVDGWSLLFKTLISTFNFENLNFILSADIKNFVCEPVNIIVTVITAIISTPHDPNTANAMSLNVCETKLSLKTNVVPIIEIYLINDVFVIMYM